MSNVDNIKIVFNSDYLLLSSGIIIFILFTYYIYRYTIPRISPGLKLLLIVIRVTILAVILMLIFEPSLLLRYKNIHEPENLIFIDNSNSIILKDSAATVKEIQSFVNSSSNRLNYRNKYYTFGSNINQFDEDSIEYLNYKESYTNIENVLAGLTLEEDNVTNVIIATDGIVNQGATTVESIEKLGLPVHTIGIGDTTNRKDVAVRKILNNKFIYAGKQTSIQLTLINEGFGGSTTTVNFYEDDIFLESRKITLNKTGINKITLNYTPQEKGEKKLRFETSILGNEKSSGNNRKTVFVNVLNNKLKVVLVGGAPSSDLSFIKRALEKDDNLSVNSIVQYADNKFTSNRFNLIDSADILFLIGFPNKNTTEQLFRKVVSAINKNNTAFFITLSGAFDFNRIQALTNELPFKLESRSIGNLNVQPFIYSRTSGLLKINSKVTPSFWESLPPINRPNIKFIKSSGANIIASSKIKNIDSGEPLIVTSSNGGKRSIALLGYDFWKWKLNGPDKRTPLYDQFISNCVKWLNVDENKKRFSIIPEKRIFYRSEQVEFSAELYDELFQPIHNAEIILEYSNSTGTGGQVFLTPAENGIYEGSFETNMVGDFEYKGSASLNGIDLGTDNGKFTIEEVNIEELNLTMNRDYLVRLANLTGGRYNYIKEAGSLFNFINEFNSKRTKEEFVTEEINIWSFEWILIFLIVFFGIEWFIRKRLGML